MSDAIVVAGAFLASLAVAIRIGWEMRGTRHYRDLDRIDTLTNVLALERRWARRSASMSLDPCGICADSIVTCPSGDPAECGGPVTDEEATTDAE